MADPYRIPPIVLTAAERVTDDFVAEMRERCDLARALAELVALRNIVLRNAGPNVGPLIIRRVPARG